MPGVLTVSMARGFPKGKPRLRNPAQPGVPSEAGARAGAQLSLPDTNTGLSAASLSLSLLFIPKINCFLFKSPAKPDDGSCFMGSSFNNLFLFSSLSLQQSFKFGVRLNLIFNFAFKTAQCEAVAPGLSHSHLLWEKLPALLPQNQLPTLFARAGLCNRQMRALHQLTGSGVVPGGSF